MFLEEIRLSKKLGNHPNIVGIVGSIIVYQPYCLILEYVDGGDLMNFLQKNKEKNQACISQEDQVFFAWQIANGMVRAGIIEAILDVRKGSLYSSYCMLHVKT